MQATAQIDKAVYNAVRDTVKQVLRAHNIKIYAMFCDKRKSAHLSNISGQQCKATVNSMNTKQLTTLNNELAQYNCKAHVLYTFLHIVYVKVLRIN